MKHSLKISALLVLMFIIAQLVGLYVINFYSPTVVVNGVQSNVTSPNNLPFGFEPSPVTQQASIGQTLLYILPSLVIAIFLFLILTKIKARTIIKVWFFIVVTAALSISFISFFPKLSYVWAIALLISIPLAFFKIYKRNLVVHNLTELLVYPGIAAIFVALFSSSLAPNRGVFVMIIILVLISFYDMWAVWHSKIMQKMAKYEMNDLKIFSGFFIPILSKKDREKIRRFREKAKKFGNSKTKFKGVKASVAILGGGDIAYPLIMSGVVLRRFGFLSILGVYVPIASFMIILGAALGLSFLFMISKKNRYYPAMPFISAGVFAALGICYLLFS